MGALVPLDDPADPRLADYVGLTDAELRRRIEQPDDATSGGGVFIAEGALAVRRLITSPYEVRSVLLTPNRVDALRAELESVEAPVYVASQRVMDAVTGFHIHRGVVAAGARRPLPLVADVIADARCVAVLEAINDHENIGAIFRNAAALGVDAVLLSPRCCDPLYRRSVRVSVGHVLTIPFTRIESWPDGLAAVRRAGFTLLALTPSPHAEAIDAVAALLPPDDRVALLLGAEGPGLSDDALETADRRVRIPMRPGGDSLNVATAAAIAFHRLARSAE